LTRLHEAIISQRKVTWAKVSKRKEERGRSIARYQKRNGAKHVKVYGKFN